MSKFQGRRSATSCYIVRRGLLLFLAVALCGWFTFTPNAGALARTPAVPAPHYDEVVAVVVVVLGDGITLDPFDGRNETPLSLHKYAYCQDNPVDHKDPSGHEIEGALAVMDIDSVSMGLRLPGVTAVSQAVSGGPDVTKTLTRTLLNVEMAFYGWSDSQVKASARELTDITSAALFGGGAATAWDIMDLYYLGAKLGPNVLSDDNHLIYRCGNGPYQRTVAVNGRVYYASAVNYALFGRAYRLLHDYYDLRGAKHADGSSEFSAEDFDIRNAVHTATAWKHWKYNDYGETSTEAEAFTAYGYNGALTSMGLPCPPSGQTLALRRFDWCWEPNKPRGR